MKPLTSIDSLTLNLPVDDVDTDQIYPGRYLTTTDREGLGDYCFKDWRDNPESDKYPIFAAHKPERQKVLVSGRNFGCGSSREHAAWSLLGMGFKAVLAPSFGDIFFSNAPKNGLLLVRISDAAQDFLYRHDANPVHIDLACRSLEITDFGSETFDIDPFTAYCLLEGIDSMDYLLRQEQQIEHFEQGHGKARSSRPK